MLLAFIHIQFVYNVIFIYQISGGFYKSQPLSYKNIQE